MCINLPVKVISSGKGKIIVEEGGEKRAVIGGLVSAKKGDYVLLQGNFAVAKVNKKEVKTILSLIKESSQKK